MENINPAEISAYVPSFNNEGTVEASVRSLLEQTIPPKEVYVIDDGSSDDTALIASRTGVEVLGNSANRGRGYTRAKAVCRAKHDLILCCDATNVLEPDFIMKTLPVFEDPKVASISGHHGVQKLGEPLADGVQGTYLKKTSNPTPVPTSMLITYGTLMRKASILRGR